MAETKENLFSLLQVHSATKCSMRTVKTDAKSRESDSTCCLLSLNSSCWTSKRSICSWTAWENSSEGVLGPTGCQSHGKKWLLLKKKKREKQQQRKGFQLFFQTSGDWSQLFPQSQTSSETFFLGLTSFIISSYIC